MSSYLNQVLTTISLRANIVIFNFHFVELFSGVNYSLYEGQFSHFSFSFFFQVSTTVSVITDLVPFSAIIVLNCLIYLAVITIIIIIIIVIIVIITTFLITVLYCLIFFAVKSFPYFILSRFCKYVKKCRYQLNRERFYCVGYSEKFTTGAKEDQYAGKKRKKGEAGPLHRDHSHSHHSGLRHLP